MTPSTTDPGRRRVAATVHDVIAAFRATSLSNRERGEKFERLMVQYLRLDPTFPFTQVWMWGEWPGRDGRPDTGIDLVAVDEATGEHTAVQCKFYEPGHTVAKPDIDSFLSASGKAPFTSRLIISTTDRWGKHAEETLRGQSTPVQRIGLAEFAASPIDWSFAGQAESLDIALAPAVRHQPRPHQAEAIEAVFGLSLSDEGVHVLDPFTGTGTFIVRLPQSGIIRTQDLLRKYTSELHANEIMLLAYYIAAVNIEATFHGVVGGGYQPFDGIVLTDTFHSGEDHDSLDADLFPQNNARLQAQRGTPHHRGRRNPPVKRWLLTHRHTDLQDEFRARIASANAEPPLLHALRDGKTAAQQRVTELTADVRAPTARVHQLERIIHILALENHGLRSDQAWTGKVAPLQTREGHGPP